MKYLIILILLLVGCKEENPYYPYQATDIQEEGDFWKGDTLVYTYRTKFNGESDTNWYIGKVKVIQTRPTLNTITIDMDGVILLPDGTIYKMSDKPIPDTLTIYGIKK